MRVIIYKHTDNIPAVIIPTSDSIKNHSIMEIALKDVPEGKPFKIVEQSELPEDISQEFWLIDDADLNDGIGGESYEFEPKEDAVIEEGGK